MGGLMCMWEPVHRWDPTWDGNCAAIFIRTVTHDKSPSADFKISTKGTERLTE